MVGKIWQRVCEAVRHIVSAVRKQKEMKAGAQLPFSFSVRLTIQPMGWGHSQVCFHSDSKVHQIDNQDYHQSRVVRLSKQKHRFSS